ncbi:enoyl-CoA hydratase/isomerase family protein [Bosea sp. 117]|uniref:enoyl-CoA hydratase/isomerase family protein n=1 Tax=Bosea sp. 117 TaxID=1125973 RepID=UPI00056F415C|nr:enoyl-CoA hydratase/isomerase family protein [Bosea sp. 117]
MSIAESDQPKTSPGTVRLAVDGPVARITFDRPSARNAMTWRMYEDLAGACATISADPSIRVTVLRGAGGKAFVAGTDIEQFLAFRSGDDAIEYEKKVEAYISGLESLPMPTIAVIDGWAVGGGMAIANACDFRVAVPGARFGVPIARTLGNCLSAANLRRLTATLGLPTVKRMIFLAETPSAEEMPPNYADVVPAEAVDAHIEAMCARIAGLAPVTLRSTKEALRRLATDPEANGSDLVRQTYGSADFREGIEAFLAKRPPQWRGE